MKLITGAQYASLTGKTAPDDALIDAVSGAVESYLDRDMSLQTRIEIHEAQPTFLGVLPTTHTEYRHPLAPATEPDKFVLLRNWPVTDIRAVGVGAREATSVKYSGSGKLASVRVDDTGVDLKDFSSTWNETSVTFSANAAVSDLRTAITAVSGWTASTKDASAEALPSNYVFPMNRSSSDGSLDTELCVPESFGSAFINPGTERQLVYDLDLFRSSTFTTNGNKILVEYTAGYAAGATPQAIQAVMASIIDAFRTSYDASGFESKKVGNFSWKVAVDASPVVGESIRAYAGVLDNFKRVEV